MKRFLHSRIYTRNRFLFIKIKCWDRLHKLIQKFNDNFMHNPRKLYYLHLVHALVNRYHSVTHLYNLLKSRVSASIYLQILYTNNEHHFYINLLPFYHRFYHYSHRVSQCFLLIFVVTITGYTFTLPFEVCYRSVPRHQHTYNSTSSSTSIEISNELNGSVRTNTLALAQSNFQQCR